jgi:hypothetical protein
MTGRDEEVGRLRRTCPHGGQEPRESAGDVARTEDDDRPAHCHRLQGVLPGRF